jgi:hypothetical protein
MRFTIRDLVWVTTFTGLSLTWWADHARIASDRARVAKDARLWRGAFDSLASYIANDGYKATVVTPDTYRASVPDADRSNASFVRDAVWVVSPHGSTIITIQK